MASLPVPVPQSPQFGVGLFQAGETFQALAGYRWSYPTATAPVWGIIDAAVSTGTAAGLQTSPGGVILPSGYIIAAGEQGLSNATAGMSRTQHAKTKPMIQHAQVLEGLGQAVEAAAAYGLATRREIPRRVSPRVIVKYVKPNVKAITAPLAKRLAKSEAQSAQAAKRERQIAARLARLERQMGRESSIAIPGIEADLGRVGRRIGDLEKRVQKLGKIAGLGAFLLLLAKALEKIGGSYIRCSNTKKWGGNVCGMNPALLDSLLAESALIVGGLSLRSLTNQVLSVEAELIAGVQKAVKELKGVKPVSEGGYANPANGTF